MWTLACRSGRVPSGPAICRTTKWDHALTDSNISSQIRPSSGQKGTPAPFHVTDAILTCLEALIPLHQGYPDLAPRSMGQRNLDVRLLDPRAQERLFWLVGV
jgi:hypothetical protein